MISARIATSKFILEKKKRNNNTPSTSKAQEKAVSVVDDDAFQEECIIEYVKELSLVETRGSTDADDGVQRSGLVYNILLHKIHDFLHLYCFNHS